MNKILIIDDDLVLARAYQHKFQLEGHEVVICPTGEHALASLQSRKPDLILLDLLLPGMNGVEVLKYVRSQPGMAGIPVIVFTNSFANTLVQDASKAGATQCLSKMECTPRQLTEIVCGTLVKASTGLTNVSAGQTPIPESFMDGFQLELRQAFLGNGPRSIALLRKSLQELARCTNEAGRQAQLLELFRVVHALTGSSAMAGFPKIAHLASALEVLLKDLHDKPRNVTSSTLRTVANAVDFLAGLLEPSNQPAGDGLPPLVVVVDDEVTSRQIVASGLTRARLRSVSFADPTLALKFLEQNRADLVISDIEMPELNGFEFCTQLRSLPSNRQTPVIFVTTLNNFETRAKSLLSGGSDVLAKPFLPIELAVKALTFLLMPRKHLEAPES
jgi:CheY-like chemotaxis protein